MELAYLPSSCQCQFEFFQTAVKDFSQLIYQMIFFLNFSKVVLGFYAHIVENLDLLIGANGDD